MSIIIKNENMFIKIQLFSFLSVQFLSFASSLLLASFSTNQRKNVKKKIEIIIVIKESFTHNLMDAMQADK